MREYDEEPDPPEDEPERPRDRKIDEAKAMLLSQYLGSGTDVFYARQLEIWLERDFFHWITAKALKELAEEGQVGRTVEVLGTHTANFYYPLRHRYPRRQIGQTIRLIAEFSDPRFTRALGAHGEMLVESGFARTGFRILQHKVRAVGSRAWVKTRHDLDFLIERDNVRYGVEIKNQLGYIGLTELQVKLAMCEAFGVRPLFITRMMPTNYMHMVNQQGGFAMLTKNQNYPLLSDDLAARVRAGLKLPVGVIRQLPDTALIRFERWHEEQQSE